MAKRQEKRPFSQLVRYVSPALLQQPLGRRQDFEEGVTFDRDMAKILTAVKSELQCDLDKFGSFLGLAAGVGVFMSAGEGNRGQQIEDILSAWVKCRGEEATVWALLSALYATDDTRAIERVAQEMRESGVDFRNVVTVPVSISTSLPEQMPPQKGFLENVEKLSQHLAQISMEKNTPPTSEKEEEDEKEEKEKEEEKEDGGHLSNSKVSQDKVAVDELQSTAVMVTGAIETQQPVTTATDPTIEEKDGHELVSGVHRTSVEKIQSDIDDLKKSNPTTEEKDELVSVDHRTPVEKMQLDNDDLKKNVEKIDTMERMKLEHRKELERNQLLHQTIEVLQAKLETAFQELQETNKQDVMLKDDNKNLKQNNQRLVDENAKIQAESGRILKENEQLRKQAADTEREKAQITDDLEKQNKKLTSYQNNLEMELRKKNAELCEKDAELRGKDAELRGKDAELDELKAKLEAQEATDSPRESGHHLQSREWIRKDKILGAGTFGKVFLAQRRGSSERFAAKQMTFTDSATTETQEAIMKSFLKEMKALQMCRHPRVVKYIDRYVVIEKDAIHFWIYMEYMSQGSLSDYMAKNKIDKLDEAQAKKYTGQLLEGLQYLHQKKIIHRDIKCRNILMDDNGDIKLADFGSVKFLGSKASSSMYGTSCWMAPELVPSGKRNDGKPIASASEKSDVWSVGATVFEMLTGKRPFYKTHHTQPTLIWELGNEKLPLNDVICHPEFSDKVEAFLRLCITWEPAKRATVDELMATSFITMK